jgi:hypothetical protein
MTIISRLYKQQNASTFITRLRVSVDPLLMVLSCKRFYTEFQCLNIYLSKLVKLVLISGDRFYLKMEAESSLRNVCFK